MFTRIARLLVVVLLVLAACGDDDASDDTTTTAAASTTTTAAATTTTAAETTTAAPETTTAAPETTTAAPVQAGSLSALSEAIGASTETQSARVEGSFEVSGADDLQGDFTIEFTGEFADESNFGFVMDLGDIAAATDEEIPPEFAEFFQDIEIRQVGDTAYVKFGLFSILGVATEWVSFPADDATNPARDLTGINPSNPSDFLDVLKDAKGEETEVGTETVRGVDTTHYRAVIDVEAVKAGLSGDELQEFEDSLPADSFPNGMPIEYWIGDDGRIYRYLIDVMGSDVIVDPEEGGFERMIMTYEIFDYGASIEIEAPPADQVTDGSQLGGAFDF
jgi:hypothetical protein